MPLYSMMTDNVSLSLNTVGSLSSNLPGEELPLTDPEEIRERMEKLVDLVIEAGPCGAQATTVIDLSSGTPQLVREGRGALAPFGLG